MRGFQVAITGVGETEYVRASPKSSLHLAVDASRKAIADAGLSSREIDGIIACSAERIDEVAYALAIEARPFTAASAVVAGAATVGAALQLAQMAILSGQASHVLVYYALKSSRPGGPRQTHLAEPLKAELEMPVGFFGQPLYFAIIANRYRYEYGLTEEQLASVSISARQWAALNPNAQRSEPLSLDSYRASQMIARPLRVADCCLITDGGGAYIVSSVERARDMPNPPAVVAGIGIGTNKWPMSSVFTQNTSLLGFPGEQSAQNAYQMAGMTPADVDAAQIYDCFSISSIIQAEMLGLCDRGAGQKLFESWQTAPGGRIPVNTSGGHLAGGYLPGMNLMIEAVRQVRGERELGQVPGLRTCAVTGLGSNAHATALLTRTL